MTISHVWPFVISINPIWRPNSINILNLLACIAHNEHGNGKYPQVIYMCMAIRFWHFRDLFNCLITIWHAWLTHRMLHVVLQCTKEGAGNSHWFLWTEWLRRQFSNSYVAQIKMRISKIYELLPQRINWSHDLNNITLQSSLICTIFHQIYLRCWIAFFADITINAVNATRCKPLNAWCEDRRL